MRFKGLRHEKTGARIRAAQKIPDAIFRGGVSFFFDVKAHAGRLLKQAAKGKRFQPIIQAFLERQVWRGDASGRGLRATG